MWYFLVSSHFLLHSRTAVVTTVTVKWVLMQVGLTIACIEHFAATTCGWMVSDLVGLSRVTSCAPCYVHTHRHEEETFIYTLCIALWLLVQCALSRRQKQLHDRSDHTEWFARDAFPALEPTYWQLLDVIVSIGVAIASRTMIGSMMVLSIHSVVQITADHCRVQLWCLTECRSNDRLSSYAAGFNSLRGDIND